MGSRNTVGEEEVLSKLRASCLKAVYNLQLGQRVPPGAPMVSQKSLMGVLSILESYDALPLEMVLSLKVALLEERENAACISRDSRAVM